MIHLLILGLLCPQMLASPLKSAPTSPRLKRPDDTDMSWASGNLTTSTPALSPQKKEALHQSFYSGLAEGVQEFHDYSPTKAQLNIVRLRCETLYGLGHSWGLFTVIAQESPPAHAAWQIGRPDDYSDWWISPVRNFPSTPSSLYLDVAVVKDPPVKVMDAFTLAAEWFEKNEKPSDWTCGFPHRQDVSISIGRNQNPALGDTAQHYYVFAVGANKYSSKIGFGQMLIGLQDGNPIFRTVDK